MMENASGAELSRVAGDAVIDDLSPGLANPATSETESRALGYGGDSLVSAATGLARETIRDGRGEIERGVEATGRVRRAGGGRPGIEKNQPGVKEALEHLVDPVTRG